ncbi:MAG: TonB-dependent receptor [Pseudomonadota bacterium]
MLHRFLALLAAGIIVSPAGAHSFETGHLVIGHPWSPPIAAGRPVGVAYLSITNNGDSADTLTGASSPLAASVQMHQTTLSEGMARMRPLAELTIASRKTVKIEPGGIHLMLVGLNGPLLAGTTFPLTLVFRNAGSITVQINVEERDAPPAAENAMTQALGVVTVVARRASSLPTQIPTTIEGITGETVARSINAADSEDALKYFPSLNVRKRYIGDFDHAVLASRASGTQNSARSLVYADGILLSNLLGNGAAFTPRWGLVTPEEIERVDVLYGPFSAAYPGNSVGAVVDYVTRVPEQLELRARVSTFTEDFHVYDTDQSYSGWQASTSYGDSSGSSAWWLDFNRLDSDGHPIAYATKLLTAGTPGTGGIPVSGAIAARNPRNQDWWLLGATNAIHTVQDHAKLKFAHDFGESLRLSYTLGAWHNEASRESTSWLRDAGGAPVWSGVVNLDGRVYNVGATEMGAAESTLTHLMHGLSLRKRGLGAWDLTLNASLYDYRRDEARSASTALPNAMSGGAGRIVDASGTGWSTLGLRADWHPDDDAHFVELGLQRDDYRLRTQISATADWLRGNAGARASAFRGATRLTSSFAQDSWQFAPRWSATLGARLERWQADDGAISNAVQTLSFPTRADTYISPKAALSFAAAPDFTVKASVGRAVRMPTVSELYQGSIALDEIVDNDPALSPERSWTGEMSGILEFDHGNFRSTVFVEDTRDALYSQVNVLGGASVTTIQNVGQVKTGGLELAGNWRALGTLELNGSVTYAHSRIAENQNFPASEGSWQPRVPEWRATALAAWRPADQLSCSLGARYSGRQFNQLDNSDPHGTAYTGTSRFFVADLRLRYEFATHWSAALGIDNVGNERYWAFHPYSRRAFSAEVSASL